jgi:hypothetical protein
MSISVDFEDLGKIKRELIPDYVTLYQEVKQSLAECRFPKIPQGQTINPYILNARVLLFAFLERKKVPKTLKPHMEFVLKKVHVLLRKMLEISLAKQYLRASLAIIELSQCFTQAMWVTDDDLTQLPLIEKSHLADLKKQNLTSIAKLKVLSEQDRISTFQSVLGYDVNQSKMLSKAVDDFPIVGVDVKHSVVGSEKIVEADIVSVFVEIKRLSAAELDASSKKVGKKEKSAKDQPSPKKPVEEQKEVKGGEESEEEFDIDSIPLVDDKKAEDSTRASLAPRFPYSKAETWLVLVFDENSRKVLGLERCSLLEDSRTVEVKIQAPSKGTYDIGVYIKSDSYRGVDKVFDFKLLVSPRKEFEIQRARQAGIDPKTLGLEEDIVDTSSGIKDEEPEAKWYYLWTTSIWEMLLLIFLLYMGVLFSADWLHTRGYISKNPFRSETLPPPPPVEVEEDTAE